MLDWTFLFFNRIVFNQRTYRIYRYRNNFYYFSNLYRPYNKLKERR
nr:MAG TPA: hypothetical protein [Caudoviricetes sp.]